MRHPVRPTRGAVPGAIRRTVDGLRQGNLAAVLGVVHRAGAVSRSRITALTGLNRSTVAALVGELVALELVVESEQGSGGRVGRPSPIVSPHAGPVAIAVNPEVDAVTIGIVGLSARRVRHVRHELSAPATPEETARLVAILLRENADELAGHRIAGIGLAVPGLVRSSDGLVRWAPHLSWADAPLADLVADATGHPTVVANDATLGATAEHLFGAGRGIDDLVYLNGGASGIGGGILSGGRLVGGHGGYAGEFGQTRPRLDESATLEESVSRVRILELLGVDALPEEELERRIAEPSDAIVAELERQTRMLSAALGGIVSTLNPEAIVLGGYLSTLLRRDPERMARLVDESAFASSADGLRLLPAELGEDRLLVGAAEAAFAALLADPAGARASTA
ncbi:MAG: ROK family transcriptional regulator [Micrococcales bacterium]|nr:ROK family transcriptional regulator [Micrococcales bacterium]